MSDGQCCGNCGLLEDIEGGMYCVWASEFVRSGGKVPGWVVYESQFQMLNSEGTDCQTWQKKEG